RVRVRTGDQEARTASSTGTLVVRGSAVHNTQSARQASRPANTGTLRLVSRQKLNLHPGVIKTSSAREVLSRIRHERSSRRSVQRALGPEALRQGNCADARLRCD